MGSSVILVLAREGKFLLDDETRFVTAHLKPLLQGMADEPGSTISHILTPSDPVVGKLLVSRDQQAMLVVVELTTKFLEFRNRGSVGRIEAEIKALRADAVVPDGLSIDISGSATLGRDITVAPSESADAIRSWTLAMILVILLKKIGLPVYLVLSVLYGYLVTLGVSYAVFWSLDPQGFPGLDWAVPIFLFTILVAVGEDYNISLVSRIEEEQKTHGAVAGITEALAKTGGIISSCGFIMAGTFASLVMGGSLARMTQLGFALAFGVLLDTFIIRPILVPAFVILIERRRGRRVA